MYLVFVILFGDTNGLTLTIFVTAFNRIRGKNMEEHLKAVCSSAIILIDKMINAGLE